jgi:ornithine cyclodeaminase
MTLLTAIRTAATSALGAKLLARPESHRLAIIGTGAQAEFQLIALCMVLSYHHKALLLIPQ